MGWDIHLSGNLHNRQMDDQDERSKRIYNQGDLRGKGEEETRESSKWCSIRIEKEELILGRGPRTDFDPPLTTPLTILLLNDLARPLTKSSQRPSSSAHFSTKLIVLGLLGLGSFTSTVKDIPSQIGTLQLAPSVERTWVLVRTIIEQGRTKPPRGNDDGQPTGLRRENR